MTIIGDQIVVTMGKNIFGYESPLFLSAKDELAEVFTDRVWVSQTVVSVYIRYLYDEILVPEQRTERFVFLCPEKTNFAYKSGDMVDYISERLTLATKPCVDTLFLSPINLGAHWVLLVINPQGDTVYYLCSLRTPLSNRKEMTDPALAMHQGHRILNKSKFSKSSKTTTKWISIEWPC